MTGVAVAAVVAGTLVGTGQAYAAVPAWKVAQTNNFPGEDGIKSISVAPAGSSWAGGYQTVKGKEVPLVQHLTSKGWTTVSGPSGLTGEVDAITASYSKNVWAFTVYGRVSHASHWNGTKWSTTSLPSDFVVSSAAAVSTNNVWVVGGGSATPPKYAEHWTGKSWHKVTLPTNAAAISAVSSSRIYATGMYKGQPAVMHWNGKTWALAKTRSSSCPIPTRKRTCATSSRCRRRTCTRLAAWSGHVVRTATPAPSRSPCTGTARPGTRR